MLKTKEFQELITIFEKSNKSLHHRYDKEDKSWWAKGQVYQSGEVNELFYAFMNGYELAKSMAIQGAFDNYVR